MVSECITSVHPLLDSELAAQMAGHDRLVFWVVRRQWLGRLSFAEALQAGRIGLWRALQSYDPARGTRFSTYAVPAIARAVWDEVAAARTASLLLSSAPSDLVAETDFSEPLHQAQVGQALHALVAALPARLRAVVVWHYGLDATLPQTFAQIGQRWAISRQRVQQLHLQALRVLAHPAHSHALRCLVGRQQRVAYQQTLARQRRHARTTRKGAR